MKYFSVFFLIIFCICISCKSGYSVLGTYKMKKYSKIDFYINGIIYSKKGFVDYAIFNEVRLFKNNTFEYIPCKNSTAGVGKFIKTKKNITLIFESGVLKSQKINLKIYKNQFFNIYKTDSTTIIYNLIKIK